MSGCVLSSHIYHRVDAASQREAMAERDLKASGPATHQTTKGELEEEAGIDATPEALAWAAPRGTAARQEDKATEG